MKSPSPERRGKDPGPSSQEGCEEHCSTLPLSLPTSHIQVPPGSKGWGPRLQVAHQGLEQRPQAGLGVRVWPQQRYWGGAGPKLWNTHTCTHAYTHMASLGLAICVVSSLRVLVISGFSLPWHQMAPERCRWMSFTWLIASRQCCAHIRDPFASLSIVLAWPGQHLEFLTTQALLF